MTSPQRARVFSLTPAYRVSDPKARGDQRAARTPLLGGTYGARRPAGNVGNPPAKAFEGPNVSQAPHRQGRLMHLARRRHESQRMLERIDCNVGFATQATARAADGQALDPPFCAGCVCCARTMVAAITMC